MELITGIDTYIGSRLFYSLANSGKPLRVCPSHQSKNKVFTHFYKSIKTKIKSYNTLEFIELDFANISDIRESLKGIDKVYHCAQFGNLVELNEKELKKHNIIATKNLVNICLGSSVSKFCFTSSFLTFPNNESQIIDENHYWTENKNRTVYEISKHEAEIEVWRGIKEGLKAFIVSPTFVLGSDFHQFSESGRILFENCIKPQSKVGIVDISDVIKAIHKLMEIYPVGEKYILNSENISLEKLIKAVKKKLEDHRAQGCLIDFFNSKINNHKMPLNFRSKLLFGQKFSNRKAVEHLGFLFRDLNSIISSMFTTK